MRPTWAHESRSLAWRTGGLTVVANMWWEPLTFDLPEPGAWHLAVATASGAWFDGARIGVPPRSIVVLADREPSSEEPS